MIHTIGTIGVVGLGLIGGSMAKAIHQYTHCTLLGWNRTDAVVTQAVTEGVVAAPLTSERLGECDLVIVALYPQATVDFVEEHKADFRKGGIVMDVCGVKGVVCTPLEDVAREGGFHFVGAHPMAGIERYGYANAFPELFQGASLIITPYPDTPEWCIEAIWAFMSRLGFARLTRATPEQHDHIIAYTSQLAHVVSCAYVDSPSAPDFSGFSAGSFKDMTRVARLSEDMWTELFLENRDALAHEIDTLAGELAAFSQAIRQGDRLKLWDMLHRARIIKETLDREG